MAGDNDSEKPSRLVRFDFPPGATPKQIAEAIEAARRRILQERDRAQVKPDDHAR